MEHADRNNFYTDRKWCPECDGYVSYLMSVQSSYCIQCGGEVRLFSTDDWQSISESLQSRRPKGGRRKTTSKGRKGA